MSLAQPSWHEPSGNQWLQKTSCSTDEMLHCGFALVGMLALRDSPPVHGRLLDSTAHAMDQFITGVEKAQGLSYASTLGQSRREKCVNNFNLMDHLPSWEWKSSFFLLPWS